MSVRAVSTAFVLAEANTDEGKSQNERPSNLTRWSAPRVAAMSRELEFKAADQCSVVISDSCK